MNSITAENISVSLNGKTILEKISFELPDGDSLAIVGPSGSGKTTLGRLIAGLSQASSGKLEIDETMVCRLVDQQDDFLAASHIPSGYYGQRYENLGLDDVPTVGDFMQNIASSVQREILHSDIPEVLRQMGMSSLLNRKLMFLSSGERKRLQLAAALLQNPDLLVLDQPFVGLDVSSRKNLEEHMMRLQAAGKTLVLICDEEHIPEHIDRVLRLEKGGAAKLIFRSEFVPEKPEKQEFEDVTHLFDLVRSSRQNLFEYAVKMKNVNVSFNGTVILKNISWEVKSGDRWALLGPNGSGKTTLLSLITADNPQGYSNDLVLFDRKRGSGETVWDIKSRIGFVSPELHLYFLRGNGIFNTIPGIGNSSGYSRRTISCQDVISSGFHDLIGFSDEPSGIQKQRMLAWLSILQLDHLAGRFFHEASLSEQRMLLLARALVKMPSVIILDEPCQGLDFRQTHRFTEMLDFICPRLGSTLIYVTHYEEEIPKCIHLRLQLQEGELVNCGEFRDSGKIRE